MHSSKRFCNALAQHISGLTCSPQCLNTVCLLRVHIRPPLRVAFLRGWAAVALHSPAFQFPYYSFAGNQIDLHEYKCISASSSPRSFARSRAWKTDAGVRTSLPDILLMWFSIASQSIVWNLSRRQSNLSQGNIVCSHNLFVILFFYSIVVLERFHPQGLRDIQVPDARSAIENVGRCIVAR